MTNRTRIPDFMPLLLADAVLVGDFTAAVLAATAVAEYLGSGDALLPAVAAIACLAAGRIRRVVAWIEQCRHHRPGGNHHVL